MTNRYEFFKQSNLIEEVDDKEAVEANIDALQYLQQEDALTHKAVKKVHEIIMKQYQEIVSEDKKKKINPGEYKDVENFVYVGRNRKVFCPPEKVEEKMDELLDWTPETPLEALRWLITHQNIHPHLDGNGRAGRVLYYYICKEVVGCEPVLFRASNRKAMYDLMNSTENLPIDPSVEFRDIDF